MKAPYETDSSGKVVQGALRIISRVKADEDVKALSTAPLANRAALKASMRARQDAEDDQFIAEGAQSAAERKVDRELIVFGRKYAGALETPERAGDKTKAFKFVFADTAPSALLPEDSAKRLTVLDGLEARIADEVKAGAEAKKLAKPLQTAIAAERKAVVAVGAKKGAYDEARDQEEAAKVATVVAVRAMGNAVQSHFADSPSHARQVLGYASSTATRRRTAAAAKAAKKSSEPAESGA